MKLSSIALLAIFVISIVFVSGCLQEKVQLPEKVEKQQKIEDKVQQEKPERVQKPEDINRAIAALSDTDKKALENVVGKMKQKNTEISGTIDSLQIMAKKRADPRLRALADNMVKIHSGNTIDVLLAKVENELNNKNENLDEDSQKLRLEVDAGLVLANDLVEHVNKTAKNDDNLVALAASVKKQETELNNLCDIDYIKKLEDSLGAKFDDKRVEDYKGELSAKYGFEKQKLEDIRQNELELEKQQK